MVRECRVVVTSPLRSERQEDGRIRFWGRISLSGGTTDRILRVVTLEDGETIHNAFLDRRCRQPPTPRNPAPRRTLAASAPKPWPAF